MVIIQEHILQQIKESLGEKGISLCEKVFEDHLDSVISNIIQEEIDGKEISEVKPYIFKNRFQKTKKRWYKSLVESLEANKSTNQKELLAEIAYARDFMSRYGEEKYKIAFDASSIDELKNIRLLKIEEWSNNPDMKIIDYLYIDDKNESQLKSALRTDILMIALNIYDNKFEGSMNVYIEYPDQLLTIPVFSSQKGKLKLSEEALLIDGVEYYAQPYTVANDLSFNTVVWKNDVDKEIISPSELKLLDQKDEEIYEIVMSSRTNIDFIRNRSIYVNVGDIVRRAYGSTSTKNYQAVVSRLNKMAHVKFTFQSKNKENIIFGLFDNIQWDSGNKTAIITVNDVIQKQIIERQVTLMYRDLVNRLEINLPKTIIFAVQKERLRMHLEEGMSNSILTYDFFVYRLQFKKRTKKANMAIIEEYLNEMKKQQVIIQDYKKVGDQYYVDFIPVQNYEIRDIVSTIEKPQSLNS